MMKKKREKETTYLKWIVYHKSIAQGAFLYFEKLPELVEKERKF